MITAAKMMFEPNVQGGSNMTGTICVCKQVTVCPGHI
jgi:hypothetical protein